MKTRCQVRPQFMKRSHSTHQETPPEHVESDAFCEGLITCNTKRICHTKVHVHATKILHKGTFYEQKLAASKYKITTVSLLRVIVWRFMVTVRGYTCTFVHARCNNDLSANKSGPPLNLNFG